MKRQIGDGAGDDSIAGTSPFTAIVQDLLDRLPKGDVAAPKDKAWCQQRSSFEGDRFIAEKGAPKLSRPTIPAR
jgi:hypothetical protein